MRNHFEQCNTVDAVKKHYRTLAMQMHPDRGGDTASMQELNRQYQNALSACHGQTSIGSDKEEHTYYYNQEREQEIIDFIDRLLRSNALKSDNVECMIIGRWVWITGDTKPVKDTLKELECRWHSKRQAWYWHKQTYRTQFNKSVSLDDLANYYGYSRVEDNEKTTSKGKQALIAA